MSYYDDYDDDCFSDEDIYYHNYSVDYANQLLGGHHAISSCLPLMRRRHHRHTPRLVRVSTLDQMPIAHRQVILPGLHSQPKYNREQEIVPQLPSRLPSLEATNDEMQRRVLRRPQPIAEENEDHAVPPVIHSVASETVPRPMTEEELRQVQQQQEAFQQHLLNMQRHLEEQTRQAEEQPPQRTPPLPSQVTTQTCSLAGCSKKRNKVSFHDLERDDDQAEIAELIETDPYFAAAMEDFAHTHGLLPDSRHRTHSENSSSRYSQQSQHSHKRHRMQTPRKPPSRLSHSSSSSSVPSVRHVARPPAPPGSNIDVILLQELQGIRRVMEEYVHEKKNRPSSTQPTISVLPVPWLMPGGQVPTSAGMHYPTVPPVTNYEPSMVPREQPSTVPEPTRAVYQNVVNAMKEVIDRRSPSQRELPLKPSDIDPKLRHVYTRPPKIPSSSRQQTLRRPLTTIQPTRRNSSQISTPPIIQPLRSPSASAIPPAPPYEPLANFASTRPRTTNQNRTLSYGNSQREGHIYDTLQPGHYLRLYTNKYHH